MKRNLFNLKLVLGGVCLAMSGMAYAQSNIRSFSFQPYIGVEYQYEHIKPSKPYRGFLSANFQYSNFFIGTRINKLFGVEVGYYLDLKNNQQQNQTFVFNGQQASAITATLSNSKYSGFSIDFAGYHQLDPSFYASIIAGFMTMHPTMSFESTSNTNLGKAFVLIKAKNNTVPRLGFGLDLLAKHWGVRSRIFWVYTQNVKMNVSAAQSAFAGITQYPYAQAVLATAGIFYRF